MKATVLIESEGKRLQQSNNFMSGFKSHLANWIASSSAMERSSVLPPPFYLAIGAGNSSNVDRDALDAEFFRVPITSKFVEPVSSRTRIITTLLPTDASSIAWGELGLFDSTDNSLVINRCDVLGKWTSPAGYTIYASPAGSVQDNGALYCEFTTIATANVTLIRTVDLSDGTNNVITNATSYKLPWYYLADVSNNGGTYTRTTHSAVDIGYSNTASSNSSPGPFPYRAAVTFDLSVLPSDANFKSIKLGGTVDYSTGNPSIDIGPYGANGTGTPSSDTATNQYNNSSTSTNYVTTSSAFNSTGTVEVDLGSTAVVDLQAALAGAAKTFSLGIMVDQDKSGQYLSFKDLYLNISYSRNIALGVNGRQFGRDGDILQYFLFLNSTSNYTTNSLYVKLGSSETSGSNEWSWTLKTNSLKNGWNLIQTALGEGSKIGTPDPAHLKRFEIATDQTSSPGIIGIDNIRFFKPNGTLLNRVVLNDGFGKAPGSAVTIQWIIDLDAGIGGRR